MAYFGLVTKLQNVRKDENSDRLYLADCFNEGVIIGSDMQTGQEVLYLPTDGEIERWFGNEFCLFARMRMEPLRADISRIMDTSELLNFAAIRVLVL